MSLKSSRTFRSSLPLGWSSLSSSVSSPPLALLKHQPQCGCLWCVCVPTGVCMHTCPALNSCLCQWCGCLLAHLYAKWYIFVEVNPFLSNIPMRGDDNEIKVIFCFSFEIITQQKLVIKEILQYWYSSYYCVVRKKFRLYSKRNKKVSISISLLQGFFSSFKMHS